MLDIPFHIKAVMYSVLALLSFASVIVGLKARSEPQKDHSELISRTKSWWIMLGLLFISLLISEKTAIWFFAFLSFLCLKEFLSIISLRQCDRRLAFWGYVAIPIQYFWIQQGWYSMFLVFIPVYVFLFLPFRAILIGETKGFIKSIGILNWSVMLTVFCISHIGYLLTMGDANSTVGGIGWVLCLILLTELNDVSQYVWGKKFGKRKIIPKISPNKTWEGFLGGVLTTSLFGLVLIPLLTPLTWGLGVLMGALISVCGFVGDVVLSGIKRDLEIKDSGRLIPGHGGILDRMDSLFYTAPVFFHVLKHNL